MNSPPCDFEGGAPGSLMRPRYLVAFVVFAFALTSLAPTIASASRSFLYYQSGVWINRVALTPKHRPVHVVNTGSGPLAIATADHRVFWTTVGSDVTGYESSIMAATAGGKGVRTLVSGLPITISLVAAHGYIYWPDEAGIGRVALDGSHLNRTYIPLPPEEGGGVADGLAIEGHYLYFSRCQDGTVGRADLDGLSTRQDLVSLGWPNCPQALATAQGRVYWAELGEAGESYGHIGSARLNGGDVNGASLVTNSEDGPFGLAAGGGFIFWSWGGSAGSPEYIARSRLDGRRANSKFTTGGSAIALMVGSSHHGSK
jgi:hypothetical protein